MGPGRAGDLLGLGLGVDCEAGDRKIGPAMAKFCVTQFGLPGLLAVVSAWLEPQTTFAIRGSGEAPE